MITLAVTDHAKEIVLGFLALASLFMVSNIARKSTPGPALAAADATPAAPMEGAEIPVGEAVEEKKKTDKTKN